MRFKIVPEPRDREFLADAQGALPLVPGTVEDCCLRILDATDAPSRDAAREYLTFLEALELAAETQRGYKRTGVDPAAADLADAFERRVFGASEVLAALDREGSLTPDAAFEAIRDEVPRWERDRHTDWESEWRERTERLLAWSVTFDLATRDGERFVAGGDREPEDE